MSAESLKHLSGVFGRAFVVCIALQVIVFGVSLAAGDWIAPLYSQLFGQPAERYDTAVHDGVMGMKLAGAVLFFVPWAALRWKARDMETRS